MNYTGIAKRVYDQIMALPDDAAEVYASMILMGGFLHDVEANKSTIQKMLDDWSAKRVEEVSKNLAKNYIMKSRAGMDVEGIAKSIGLFSTISKDVYTDAERSANARRQWRNPQGRFRSMNRKIIYTSGEPHSNKHAERLGIPAPAAELNRADKARYQQAYQQVERALRHADPEESVVTLLYRNGDGSPTTKNYLFDGEIPKLDSSVFASGGTLHSIQIDHPSDLSVGGAAYDLAGALGGNDWAAEGVRRSFAQNEQGQFIGAQKLRANIDDYQKKTNVWGRMSSASRALQDIAGPNVSDRTKLALKTADFVGQYGNEAERVIGPHADRAAYRYRGIERKPDPGLQRVISGTRQNLREPNQARNALIYGHEREVATRGGVRREAVPSPLIEYFRNRIPDADLINLQTASGNIPPSEGIIIDRQGRVVTQAVGYGDDWYLPFNLKTLGKLKGGEYIRTRTWGGPTTEDIYTGLVSGARAVTVVSHNGVYTIEFDKSFRGSRRYNDKAARMVKRYGQILDAVQSRNVTLAQIPGDRKDEIRAEVGREYSERYDPTGFKAELERREKLERDNPQMSQKAKDAAAEEFLNAEAEKIQTPTGELVDWKTQRDAWANRQALEAHTTANASGLGEMYNYNQARQFFASQVDTPQKFIAVSGQQERFDKYMEGVERDYRNSQRPLQLNGAGYERAMKALEQQFPYYIAKTSWQPKDERGFDPGYIKPRFNRPAAAQAGYYDKTITGSGKISADRTRHQNEGVLRRLPAEDKPKEDTTSSASTKREVSPEAREFSAVEARMALWKSLKEQKSYSGAMAGQEFNAAHLGSAGAGLKLVPMEERQAREMAAREPDVFDQMMTADLGIIRDKGNFLRIDPKLEDKWRDPTATAKESDFNLVAALNDPEKDYKFGHAFEAGHEPAAYQAAAKSLGEQLGIDANLDDPDLDNKANAFIEQARAVLRDQAEDPAIGPGALNEAKRKAEAALRLKQAKRRYQARVAQKAREEALKPKALTNTEQPDQLTQFFLMNPEQLKAMGLGGVNDLSNAGEHEGHRIIEHKKDND